jgi:hypothetical protein
MPHVVVATDFIRGPIKAHLHNQTECTVNGEAHSSLYAVSHVARAHQLLR